jgi:DNA-binding transcriptional LysR family regulator
MKTYQYRYILAIAEQRSLRKAAEVLFVSQPYLSKLVSSVEEELGVQIFNRSRQPLTVTPAGECYITFIREMFYSEQKMKAKMGEITAHRAGRLTIGIPRTLGSYIIPGALKRFREQYPNIQVSLDEQTNNILVEHLQNGIIDLCLLSMPEYPKEFHCEIIKWEYILLVLPPEHPLGTVWTKGNYQNPVSFSDSFAEQLANEQFIIMPETQGMGKWARIVFEKFRINPKIYMETHNIETAYRLAAAGIGLAVIPENCTAFSRFKDDPHYFSIGAPPLTRSLWGFAPKMNIFAIYCKNIPYKLPKEPDNRNFCMNMQKFT